MEISASWRQQKTSCILFSSCYYCCCCSWIFACNCFLLHLKRGKSLFCKSILLSSVSYYCLLFLLHRVVVERYWNNELNVYLVDCCCCCFRSLERQTTTTTEQCQKKITPCLLKHLLWLQQQNKRMIKATTSTTAQQQFCWPTVRYVRMFVRSHET